MASIPRPKTSTSVVGGSVGRQSINAPVEAFGGGRAASGLVSLGQGVSGVGQGLEVAGRKQIAEAEKRNADAEAKKKAAVKAESDRLKAIDKLRMEQLKLRDDRKTLEYNKKMQGVSSTLKNQQGINKNGAYDEESKNAQNELLKDVTDPMERERLLIKMQESDLARSNSLYSAQAQEIKAYKASVRSSQKVSLGNGMRENGDTLNADNVNEWIGQFKPQATEYGLGLVSDGVPADRVNQLIKEDLKGGVVNVVKDKIATIGGGMPAKNTKDTLLLIESLLRGKVINEEEAKTLSDHATRAGKDATDLLEERQVEARKKVLTELGDTMSNLKSQPERNQEYQRFILDNPDMEKAAHNVWKSNKVITSPAVAAEWTDKLMSTRDPEDYKKKLNDAYLNGDISESFYNEQRNAADKDIDERKSTIWASLTQRLKAMGDGNPLPGDKEKIPGNLGMFGRDAKITKDFLEDWKSLRLLAMNKNVTYRELQEAVDKALFKPEAAMASKNAEERLNWVFGALGQASALPGTQDLSRVGVDAFKNMTDDEVIKKLSDSIIKKSEKKLNLDRGFGL